MGQALLGGRYHAQGQQKRTDHVEASRTAGDRVQVDLTAWRSKGPKPTRFDPSSVLCRRRQVGQAPLSRSAWHQCSHVGLKPGTDSRIASSWYQLPLQMVSFTRGAFWI